MRKWTPLAAVLLLTAAILSCDDPPDVGPPEADAATIELSAQAADSFEIMATWRPTTFLGDTVDTYLRDVGRQDGTWADFDTVSAVGSELRAIPSPPAGSTAVYDYCLRSVGVDEVGDTVSTPDSLAACATFQYTAPTSLPPAPDSLEVDPQAAIALDSAVLYPADLTLQVGDTAQLTMALYVDGQVVGCSGACDTVAISAADWDRGAPVYIAQRPGYPFGEEWMARRLPWLRQLERGA